MATPTRPKQRVLVRWNDDLDKSLLLFITHTCTELGIKIPYDEVARRMGSTFTEGAIQQHISKLRNKMAELNVAPVPAAPKRGAVTVKPSSVYGQKGRAGPAPQQPVASKSQARASSNQPDNNTTTAPTTTTRRGRRRQATIKRSESDEGPTDDEFGGASDDDFQANPNDNGKRARGAGRQAPASKKVTSTQPQKLSESATMMKSIADADARYDLAVAKDPSLTSTKLHPLFVQQSVEAHSNPAVPFPDPSTRYGQLIKAAGYNEEEEEEEEEEPTELVASHQPAVLPHNPAPFSFVQNQLFSPTSISGMPTQFGQHPQYDSSQATNNNYLNNFQQASQPLTDSQNSGLNSINSESGFSDYLLASQPRLPFRPNYTTPQMPPPYPLATVPAISGYSGMQQGMRNDSMVSTSSQNTFVQPPQTPTFDTSAGINTTNQSPFNEWARPEFNNSSIAPNHASNAWGFDNSVEMNHAYDSALFNDGANAGESFMQNLFG